ncbi:MAG: pyridoxal phosphate-dependent aminotransferase [Enterocloster bolteae]|uniref:pyridoxal phosphate-dependent aminotransferase n=1 Tax=Enterocloster bolteae TaxID=208479 RepID=UPI0039910304
MKAKTSKRMDNLIPSGIRKVNEKALAMERAGEHIIHFEIGRPDFDTPEYIKKACEESIKKGNVFYTSNYGTTELREAVAEKLNRENGLDYRASEILISVGLSEAVFDVLCTILDEGDEILVPDPVWMNYINVPRMLGAVPVLYSLREDNGFQIDLQELSAKITNKTKAIVLVTPNNPTGGMLSAKTLEGLSEIAIEHDLLVISDEIYERLVYDDDKHISIASYPSMKERTFTMNGFSKAYSMTGWRVGYVAAPEEYIQTINKIHQHNTTCAPSFAQYASVIALKEEKDEVHNMVKEYKRRRDYAVKAINEIPNVSCLSPKGAFYIFINVKALGKPSAVIAQELLEKSKIALVPGDVFGPGGEGYIRMSFANSFDNIVEGCKRLREGLERLS